MSSPAPSRRRARHQETKLWRAPVARTERITPRMARVTVRDETLAGFGGGGTDQHVLLYLYEPGVTLPEPLTMTTARGALSSVRPRMRSYTVRRHDREAREIDFDFVLHDHAGPASEWARQAQPGDELIFVGPSPAYRPDLTADAHLLVGDETALPAIGAILEELPAEARVRAFIEVECAEEEQRLTTAASADITWLHRDGLPPGRNTLLADALAEATLPEGTLDVWAAGERAAMRDVRHHLVTERGLDRRRVRPSTYWRAGEEGSTSG
jgi:NADPH-dependent ferric siderophore reductase